MILPDIIMEVFFIGIAIICFALFQLKKGVTLSYKNFLDPSVVYKNKAEDRFSFYFSVFSQLFVGAVALVLVFIGVLSG